MLDLFASLLFSVEEDAADEADNRGSDYLTKADAKYLALALGLFLIVAIPGYYYLRDESDTYHCKMHFQAISEALATYESENDERLPPAYFASVDPNIPQLDDKNRPITWATTLANIAGIDHLDGQTTFMCPTADKSQAAVTEGPDGKDLLMTYGMYLGLSTQVTTNFTDPGNVVSIAETANGGKFGTFDPVPIRPDGKNTPANDAYLIGYSNGDLIPKTDTLPPPSVTRLAYFNSQNGIDQDGLGGRHGDSIFCLFLDGHFELLKSYQAGNPNHWPVPNSK